MSQGQETRIKGRVGKDGVTLRFTPNGVAVANFSVAHTKRRQVNGQWEDGETLWMPVTAWNQKAENAAASLKQGTEVIVIGELNQRKWNDKTTGDPRSVVELVADSISIPLDYVTVEVTKNERRDNNGGGRSYTPRNNDSQSAPESNNRNNAPVDDEPPF